MKRHTLIVFLIVIAICVGCQSAPPKLLHETVRVPPDDWSVSELAYDETKLSKDNDSVSKPLSYYLGVFQRHYHYRGIYNGLKAVRAALLLKDDEFIFEIQTDGDIELARKEYGKRMQFLIDFIGMHPFQLRIITTGSMEEALLVSGEIGNFRFVVDENDKAISARLESKYKVEARLRLEIERDRLRIYIPEKAVPETAKKWWSKERAAFTWQVSVGLALEPLDPIPTNLPGLYFVPQVYRIWYPASRGSLARFPPLWSVVRASDASKKGETGDSE